MGVIAHRSGRRELLVYDRGDPDACDAVIGLGEDDTRTLVDLLGERVQARSRHPPAVEPVEDPGHMPQMGIEDLKDDIDISKSASHNARDVARNGTL